MYKRQHSDTVERAVCALSHFSCEELETVFDTKGGILGIVCGQLSLKTRKCMSFRVSEHYKSFATDALALTLPLVEKRRNRLGISHKMHTHPLVDMLMTVPKAKEWNPLMGKLRLHVDDFRKAHPQTRSALDALGEQGVLVTVKGNTPASKRKIEYEFDTWVLEQLFRQWVRESTHPMDL